MKKLLFCCCMIIQKILAVFCGIECLGAEARRSLLWESGEDMVLSSARTMCVAISLLHKLTVLLLYTTKRVGSNHQV